MRATLLGTLVAAALLTACSGAEHKKGREQDATANKEAVLARINEVENIQLDALARGDVRGATDIYTPDARFYAPGRKAAFGREEIVADFDAMIADDAYEVLIDSGSRRSWVSASGDLAATGFTGRVTRTDDGKVVTVPFVNSTIWIKQADGNWQVDSDVNAVLPEREK